MRPAARRSLALALSLAIAASLVTACAPKGPTWVDAGASYSAQSVTALYAKADTSTVPTGIVADTAQARHDALTELRKRSGAASSAADLITKTLPMSERGIPVYAERASYDGQPAVLLIEVTGPANRPLTTKRLWVLSASGAVLFVGTR